MMRKNSKTFFEFDKKGAMFKKPAGMPFPGPYYTCLVPMQKVKDFPFEYALYFSTDHHHGRGGIWLYLCNGIPSNPKNWKSYDQAVKDGEFDYLAVKPKKNPIFVDRIQGSHHTETPHANVIDGKVFMSYHHLGSWGKQATLMATSPDGVNFERINGKKDSVILDPKYGAGHTGYFRWGPNVFPKVEFRYIGYSLHGGGDNYHSAMWGSNDAVEWTKLQIFTPMEGYTMEEKDTIMIWHDIDPGSAVKIGEDEYVLLSAGGNRASGGVARTVELYEIFLAGDGKTLTRNSRKVIPKGPAKSPDSEEISAASTVKIGNIWYLIYVGASRKGRRNNVMAAVGDFNMEAPLSRKLAPDDLQRNFYSAH